jgi:CRP/FNR family cyclic AMP-dependent transcriptional regulator
VTVLTHDPDAPVNARRGARSLGQCRLLAEDPDLAAAIPQPLRQRAVHECVAPVVTIPRGRLSRPPALADAGGIGLVILDGLLLRRVGIEGRFGGELLGEGDLIGPQRPERPLGSLSHTTGWRVLETARLAVLDVHAAHRLARYPALTGALVARALERSRNFAVVMAIVHQPKVELRLHMLLWHLAGRWGRVGPQGVRLPLRLTHAVLADLIAARRPTVTGAIAKLCDHGLVDHDQGGWLLRGDPPGELLAVRSIHPSRAQGGENSPRD